MEVRKDQVQYIYANHTLYIIKIKSIYMNTYTVHTLILSHSARDADTSTDVSAKNLFKMITLAIAPITNTIGSSPSGIRVLWQTFIHFTYSCLLCLYTKKGKVFNFFWCILLCKEVRFFVCIFCLANYRTNCVLNFRKASNGPRTEGF